MQRSPLNSLTQILSTPGEGLSIFAAWGAWILQGCGLLGLPALAFGLMVGLSGCLVGEYARGHDRELVMGVGSNGSGGTSPSIEYRISRRGSVQGDGKTLRPEEVRGEIERMFRDLGAGKLPGEAGLKPGKEVAK